MNLTTLEKDVLEKLLVGRNNQILILKTQLAYLSVVKRDYTEHGFFTYFSVNNKKVKLDSAKDMKFGDVCARINGLNFGMGFLLYLKDGYIHCLEGYTFEEKVPKTISDYTIFYFNGEDEYMKKIDKLF